MPFDVVKTRMQTQIYDLSGDGCYTTVTQTISSIVRERGVKGLYSGLTWKLIRLGPGSAIVFMVYEHILSRF